MFSCSSLRSSSKASSFDLICTVLHQYTGYVRQVEPALGSNDVMHLSPVIRIPAFCICENRDADHSNCTGDQRLCFRHIGSTIPVLLKTEVSSLYQSYVAVQTGLCLTGSETPKTGFFETRLMKALLDALNALEIGLS